MNQSNPISKSIATLFCLTSMTLGFASSAQADENVTVSCALFSSTGTCFAIADGSQPQPYFFNWSTSGPVAFYSTIPFNCNETETFGDDLIARCPIKCMGFGHAGVTVEVFDANRNLVGLDSTSFSCDGTGGEF